MADVNKTQAIRDLLKENPKLMPLEISNILKEKGVEVTRAFASVVKSNFNKKSKETKPEASFSAKKKRVKTDSNKSSLDISVLFEIKKLFDKYGKETVEEAVSAISRLS